MLEIVIDIHAPRLHLSLPAEGESLPIVRQALRSLGEAVRAERDALEDAELAVTEACANVVEHAYGHGTGLLQVLFEPGGADLLVTVTDHGFGVPATPRGEGFGLAMIESIAREVEVRRRPDGGTDVVMSLALGARALSLNGGVHGAAAPLERIARRLVAVIAAQVDMPSDRIVESLLAVELAARHAPAYLLGNRAQLTLERLSGGFDLRLGPLVADGARALVSESELPVIGAVIERFADQVEVERPAPESERLRLRIGSGQPDSAARLG